jgi:3-hydroxyacyl-[acyl-carrier-protein] dehydratase
VLFASIEEAKFRRPVRPGDQLRMEIDVLSRKTTFARMKGKTFVEGDLVCEAIVLCKIMGKFAERNALPPKPAEDRAIDVKASEKAMEEKAVVGTQSGKE